MRYDHTNYARQGAIYIAEMHQLPELVLSEFRKGNYVVKRSEAKFNQVSHDQGQEWLNREEGRRDSRYHKDTLSVE